MEEKSQVNYHKKNILQVIPSLVSGGVERGTIEIAKKLKSSGYNSVVVSAGGPLVQKLIEEGIPHIKLDVATKNPFKIWSNTKLISQIVKDHEIDIIHARSRAPAWSCYMSAQANGTKFITTFHGIYNINNFFKRYYNSIMTEGERIIAVSNFVKRHILENYHTNEEKIRVIHRGVDHRYFDPARLQDEILAKMRDKYHIPAGVPVVLLPSRFTNWKGQTVLVEALKKIKHLDFFCIMVGDNAKHPAYVHRLRDNIINSRLQSKVQIFGNESDMLSLYGIADIVLSTSIEPEAFGRTITEGQAMQKLVIATNIGGAAETIEDEKTGFHISPNDADELAEKISYCLSILGSDKADEITKAARDSSITKFSLDLMFTKTLAVYNEL
jgi:glycosyltransferase involved in cell wall biosynthesis